MLRVMQLDTGGTRALMIFSSNCKLLVLPTSAHLVGAVGQGEGISFLLLL